MTGMEEDQKTFAARTLENELTEKGTEYRALSSIQKAADDPKHIAQNEAKTILRDWKAANDLPEPSRTKEQTKVRKRIMKFVREYPS